MTALDVYDRWLLEMVVELSYPLALLGDPQLRVHLNRRAPDLPADEIATRVHRLTSDGLLELVELDADSDVRRELSRDAIATAVVAGGPTELVGFDAPSGEGLGEGIYFQLSARGAAAWEAFAKPDWSRYVRTEIGEDHVIVTGCERAVIERTRAVAWEQVAPWQATYWKIVPVAIRCRVPFADGSFEVRRDHWFEHVDLPTR